MVRLLQQKQAATKGGLNNKDANAARLQKEQREKRDKLVQNRRAAGSQQQPQQQQQQQQQKQQPKKLPAQGKFQRPQQKLVQKGQKGQQQKGQQQKGQQQKGQQNGQPKQQQAQQGQKKLLIKRKPGANVAAKKPNQPQAQQSQQAQRAPKQLRRAHATVGGSKVGQLKLAQVKPGQGKGAVPGTQKKLIINSALLSQRAQLRKLTAGAIRLPKIRQAPGMINKRLAQKPIKQLASAKLGGGLKLLNNPQAQLIAQQVALQKLVLQQQQQLDKLQQRQQKQQTNLRNPPKLAITINNPDAVTETPQHYAPFAPVQEPVRVASASVVRNSLSDRFGMFRSG
jgi:hypothetical protein